MSLVPSRQQTRAALAATAQTQGPHVVCSVLVFVCLFVLQESLAILSDKFFISCKEIKGIQTVKEK